MPKNPRWNYLQLRQRARQKNVRMVSEEKIVSLVKVFLMGDMGDYWRDVKEYYRSIQPYLDANERRALKKLKESNFKFRRFSEHHFRVFRNEREYFDWWPSTGRWISSDKNSRGRGINDLLRKLQHTDIMETK